jgi:regulatory protein
MSREERSSGPSGRKRPLPALNSAALERLALRYVERFATTRGRLTAYLHRKIRERGWDGAESDPAALAEKRAALGYVDDRAFAEARATAMARRGLGKRRVQGALRQAGIDASDSAAVAPGIEQRKVAAAVEFARRKRIGPYAIAEAERPQREKQIAAMIRAGHDFTLSRTIATMAPGDEVSPLYDGQDA